jgi:hypothetical protein
MEPERLFALYVLPAAPWRIPASANIAKLTPDRKDCSRVASASIPTPKATQTQGATTETTVPEAATQERAPTPMLQPKLAVNPPGDASEQEADRVADHVMRMPVPDSALQSLSSDTTGLLRRQCSCGGAGGECTACAEKREEGVQRSVAASAQSASRSNFAAPPMVHQMLNSPGQPLDPAARAYMEPRFGHDFSMFRVLASWNAAVSVRSILVLAFTSPHNIVFGPGQYSPGTSQGRKLLAHELTHVLQQQTGISTIQRQGAPVDVTARATEVEHLVRPGNDEKGALDKLKALDMADLLKVVEQIYER